MTERRRTFGRGTRKRAAADQPSPESLEKNVDANPYLDVANEAAAPRPRKPRTPKAKLADAGSVDASPPSPSPAAPATRSTTRSANPRTTRSATIRAASSEATPAASYVAPPSPPQAAPPVADIVTSRDTGNTISSGNTSGNDTPTGETVREGNSGESGRNEEYRNNGNFRGGRYRRFRHRKQGQGNNQGQGNQNQGNNQGQNQNNHQSNHSQGHNHNQSGQSQHHNNNNGNYAGRRQHRRNKYDNTPRGPIGPVIVEGEATGWFDTQRDSGFIRNANNSYLADPNDPFVPIQMVRQYGLRRGDLITASIGRDQRNRIVVADILSINDTDPALAERRPDFQTLVASYPERKLALETGKPAKGGPELTRRAIDLIAPIGYGQRALIVAPARAGKTMLLQAVIEGIAINHPQASLFVLLVDERPEEVSDMITLGYGEVIASSFDMPAARHTDVAEMTLERARRLVELGRDVVIVLDSITRLARAYNTVERGTGRTLSGGLDSSAMAKPKAFFGSARSVSEQHGGGSLTIIATALVETGSRMDDVIFEEFKGTGNCEIKLDRSLAEKRIFPAVDIAVSGTRREDKLFRPDQLEHVYTLRRGLQQMPSSSAMEWLIKRISGTTNNDGLLSGL